MTVYLLNALPNALINDDEPTILRPVSAQTVAYEVSVRNEYERYDDITPPRNFNAVSAVGHESTAHLFSRVLEDAIGACYGFRPIIGHFVIPVNRIQVTPQKGDTVYCGLFTPPRRLAEGEQWTEEEILSCPIKWICIDY